MLLQYLRLLTPQAIIQALEKASDRGIRMIQLSTINLNIP
jgi:hypothetical protein